ncbi:hypothetical protein BC833DRAFT_376548 [Globomyces pollinis-pini]|nr:hypothetical protein BC833DRAFT_376548 [Globomyces pollinis-pini]
MLMCHIHATVDLTILYPLQKMRRNLEKLPTELICSIVSYLKLSDFLSVSRSSKKLNCITFRFKQLQELYNSKALFKKPALFKQYLMLDSFDYHEALQFAINNEHLAIVKLLLIYSDVDPSAHNNAYLVKTIHLGYVDIFKLLVNDSRVDPSTNNNVLIRLACTYGNADIVTTLLVDERVDPSAVNNTPIIEAAQKG